MKWNLALFVFCAVCLKAAVWVSDGSDTDVIAKIASAADGDTVTLPSGIFDWDEQVTTAKAITIS